MPISKNKHVEPSSSGGPTDTLTGPIRSLGGGHNVSAVGADVIAMITCTIGILQTFLSKVIQHG